MTACDDRLYFLKIVRHGQVCWCTSQIHELNAANRKNALFLFFNSEFSSHPTDAKKTIDHKPRGSQGSQYTQSH